MNPYYNRHTINIQPHNLDYVFPVRQHYYPLDRPVMYVALPICFYPQPAMNYLSEPGAVASVHPPMMLNHSSINSDPTPNVGNQIQEDRVFQTFGVDAAMEEAWRMIELETNLDRERQETISSSGLSEERISKHLRERAAIEAGKTGGNCENGEDDDICAICLGEYEEHARMKRLQCGHGYHEECIKRWLLRKNVCPMCRATAVTI